MEIIKLKITDVKPYDKNPRKNDGAVDAVAESIKQCGYCAPIVIDEDNVQSAKIAHYFFIYVLLSSCFILFS